MYIAIAGGELIGRRLAARLIEHRHDVVLVEPDKELCEEVCARTGCLAFHGSPTDVELLEEAGVAKADVAVAVLQKDADNLAFSLLARNLGVPRVVARMRNPRYEKAFNMAGAQVVLNVVDLFVPRLVLHVEQPNLRHVATFGGGKAFIAVAVVPEGARVDGLTVAEIAGDRGFPEDCVIAGIYRESSREFIIPRGKKSVRAGDQVFLAAEAAALKAASEWLQRTS